MLAPLTLSTLIECSLLRSTSTKSSAPAGLVASPAAHKKLRLTRHATARLAQRTPLYAEHLLSAVESNRCVWLRPPCPVRAYALVHVEGFDEQVVAVLDASRTTLVTVIALSQWRERHPDKASESIVLLAKMASVPLSQTPANTSSSAGIRPEKTLLASYRFQATVSSFSSEITSKEVSFFNLQAEEANDFGVRLKRQRTRMGAKNEAHSALPHLLASVRFQRKLWAKLCSQVPDVATTTGLFVDIYCGQVDVPRRASLSAWAATALPPPSN